MFFFRKLTVIGQIKNDPHLFRMFLVLEFVLGFVFPCSLNFASASAFASAFVSVFRHWH